MVEWKRHHERETIKILEEAGIFTPGAVVPNEESPYQEDYILTNGTGKIELKTIFSTVHDPKMYAKGFDANNVVYLRSDQLQRYTEKDKTRGNIRWILFDRRLVKKTPSIARVNQFIREKIGANYGAHYS